MIDNHNRFEWVNVSSGTGSPGLSQTQSRELQNGSGISSCSSDQFQPQKIACVYHFSQLLGI